MKIRLLRYGAPQEPADMRRRHVLAAALGGWSLAAPALLNAQERDATPSPLKLGLSPFFAPATTLRVFRRMREHLGRSLDRPVETFTARDLRSFAEKTRGHEYDIVLIPAHFARLAIIEWGYVPMAATLPSTTIQLLVRRDSKAQSIADLKGSRIGAADRLSTIWLITAAWLQRQGIDVDRDLQFVLQPSGSSALYALTNGDIDATPMVNTQLLDMPPEVPRNYRVLVDVGPTVSPVFLARAGLPPAELTRIRGALLAFEPDAALPTTSSNTRLSPLHLKDLDGLEAAMQAARRILDAPP